MLLGVRLSILLVGGDGGEGSGGDVAPSGGHLFVVDLDEERADEADDRLGVGEDLDDVGASFRFPVQSLDRLFDHGPALGSVDFGVGLSEDRADQRGDHQAMLVFADSEQVPHGMNATSLPAGALEHPADRGFEAGVGVGDHQADPVRPLTVRISSRFRGDAWSTF